MYRRTRQTGRLLRPRPRAVRSRAFRSDTIRFADPLHERLYLGRVFATRLRFQAARGIDPKWPDLKDKVGYVLGAQSSGDNEPEPRVHGSARPVPIGALSGAAGHFGVVGVKEV